MFDFGQGFWRCLSAGDGGASGGESGVTGQAAAAEGVNETGASTEVEAAGGEQDASAAESQKDRAARFADLLKGEFKDDLNAWSNERVEKAVKGRLKNAKAAEDSMSRLQPALKVLQKAYGTEDLDALAQAIQNDDHYYEDEAMKRGMDVETYKALQQKDAQLEAYREQQEALRVQQEQAQQVMQWRQEEAKLKETFPDFDLDAEIEQSNGELFEMLRRGIPLEHAFQVLHFDEIVGGSLAEAYQRGAKRTQESIRANGMRPQENGAGVNPGQKAKVDVNRLSKAQVAEIERRVARGETITPEMFESIKG